MTIQMKIEGKPTIQNIPWILAITKQLWEETHSYAMIVCISLSDNLNSLKAFESLSQKFSIFSK